jgi:urocanate hydratase
MITDKLIANMFPKNEGLQRWLRLAKTRIAFQGLPARICWLGQGEREQAGLAFNELVRSGTISAPIVIGRDHWIQEVWHLQTGKQKACSME